MVGRQSELDFLVGFLNRPPRLDKPQIFPQTLLSKAMDKAIAAFHGELESNLTNLIAPEMYAPYDLKAAGST